MFKIVEKRQLSANIFEMKIAAERVARAALPGQFVIVRADEGGERVPLTIADYDVERGTVTIVTQTIGHSTKKICSLEVGESLPDFAGPLGRPSEFVHMPLEELKNRKYLFVAGGVGTAPVYPQVKWLHEHGVTADVIIGAKSKDLLIYIDEMKKVGNVHIATDDGSEGYHGMVTGLMKELVEVEGRKYDECVCIGPMIMMKFVCLTTKAWDLQTTVSLNALMVDGTGMCGACRVSVGGKTLFTCVDGPEFDGHKVDFDEAIRRQGMYKNQERNAEENHEHKCNCYGK
ncbi:MAG: sulfide/dihydroorotate dehydrogenase-like FAD/NAD-binding protein [Alistipes sp.]|nr:sulfide/dihydroorotate dehydrogenase-like FAD/NAD-binding protein [Alistipes sp.]